MYIYTLYLYVCMYSERGWHENSLMFVSTEPCIFQNQRPFIITDICKKGDEVAEEQNDRGGKRVKRSNRKI